MGFEGKKATAKLEGLNFVCDCPGVVSEGVLGGAAGLET